VNTVSQHNPRLDELTDLSISRQLPPIGRQIFTNRPVRLETIRFIGFDLDWTLADYNRLPLLQLILELTIDRLIEHFNYPKEIRSIEFRPDFSRRGLLIDKEAGTVLKMNRHRYVGLAYYGRRRLDRRDLKKLYRYEPLKPSGDRFYHLDSIFELPEANLFSEFIHLIDRGVAGFPDSFRQLFSDTREATDWVHAESTLKERILADIESYLPRDEELLVALERLAMGNRKLLLITNSDWSYASQVCSYLLEGDLRGSNDWRDLFDLVIASSRKPTFFRNGDPFIELDASGDSVQETAEPAWGGIYRNGSLSGLMGLLKAPGEQVLYVGDHIYGDVVSSKLESTWRTALIVREIEEELESRQKHAKDLQLDHELRWRLSHLGYRMDHLRDAIAIAEKARREQNHSGHPDIDNLRVALREVTGAHRSILRQEADLAESIDRRLNPCWGSFFKQGTTKSRFSSQLESYACLYTSRVSNFGHYGSNHYFRVLEDQMIHETTGATDDQP
jgi:HAD superfamily 5'-nucleotidase-like hydrolase